MGQIFGQESEEKTTQFAFRLSADGFKQKTLKSPNSLGPAFSSGDGEESEHGVAKVVVVERSSRPYSWLNLRYVRIFVGDEVASGVEVKKGH